ncbi:MAG TPA: LysR family transcriptional regulator [Thermomicrobiales bacterium]|nr:LysR family transcriptional regulator [Thermomicrobiales bacterium]
MDQNQLVSFERIAREGSFSRAARSLDMSQAAISGRIQALEAEIGASLFVRGGRKVTLTGAGETFLPYARRALAEMSEGVETARQEHSGQYGRVTVGAIDSVANGLLVPVVARFQSDHPAVVISVRTGHTPQIVEELADGVVRLGLVTWSYVTGAVDLDLIARFRDPLVAVVAPGHPLAAQDRTTIDEVEREGRPFHETAWGTLADARIARAAQRSWNDHELPHGLMQQLIVRGIGAGFLPASLVADDLASSRLVALNVSDAADLTREIALVCRASVEELPPVAREFADAIVAQEASTWERFALTPLPPNSGR